MVLHFVPVRLARKIGSLVRHEASSEGLELPFAGTK
jgi:hypothetical protein